MTNCIFGFPRVTSSFVLSGAGEWLATYPLSNMRLLPLSKVARASITTTSFVATSQVPQRVGMIALVRHNLSPTAQIRVLCWGDIGLLDAVYDSGVINVWPEIYSYDSLEWEDNAYWGGSYTIEELDGAIWTFFHRFSDTGEMIAVIQIDIYDPANPYGYVQAGYFELATAYEVSYNFDWGFQYGFQWRSQLTEAIGGSEYVDRRIKPRTVKGTFSFTLRDEAMRNFYEMARQHDVVDPILFIPLPDEPEHYLRTVMFARQMDPGLAAMRVGSNLGQIDSVPLALREIIG